MKNIKHYLLLALTQCALLCAGSANAELLSTTYYHNDALGSPIAATSETGAVKWRENYHPYGDRINNAVEASDNSRWYTGHVHDQSTGLTYAGARYYDPIVGRFMAVDPVDFSEGNAQSFNRYVYANNNPYRFVDPDGEEPVEDFLPEGAPIVAMGKSFGSLAAYVEGVTTGNESLKNTALAGMAEQKQSNIESLVILATMGRGSQAGVAKNARTPTGPIFKNTAEATKAAKELGFTRINETIKKQAVFKRGDQYITRDIDGHSGGAWKMADSVKNLASKKTRAGTYDVNLKRIGD